MQQSLQSSSLWETLIRKFQFSQKRVMTFMCLLLGLGKVCTVLATEGGERNVFWRYKLETNIDIWRYKILLHSTTAGIGKPDREYRISSSPSPVLLGVKFISSPKRASNWWSWIVLDLIHDMLWKLNSWIFMRGTWAPFRHFDVSARPRVTQVFELFSNS